MNTRNIFIIFNIFVIISLIFTAIYGRIKLDEYKKNWQYDDFKGYIVDYKITHFNHTDNNIYHLNFVAQTLNFDKCIYNNYYVGPIENVNIIVNAMLNTEIHWSLKDNTQICIELQHKNTDKFINMIVLSSVCLIAPVMSIIMAMLLWRD